MCAFLSIFLMKDSLLTQFRGYARTETLQKIMIASWAMGFQEKNLFRFPDTAG